MPQLPQVLPLLTCRRETRVRRARSLESAGDALGDRRRLPLIIPFGVGNEDRLGGIDPGEFQERLVEKLAGGRTRFARPDRRVAPSALRTSCGER